MVRKAVAALAGLGLVGGAGSVAYSQHGDALVKIKEAGHVQTVSIKGDGHAFSCPSGTHDRVAPLDVELGRIELTLTKGRSAERAIERRYPRHDAPPAVVRRFDATVRRDNRLIAAYNRVVAEHNRIIRDTCTPESHA